MSPSTPVCREPSPSLGRGAPRALSRHAGIRHYVEWHTRCEGGARRWHSMRQWIVLTLALVIGGCIPEGYPVAGDPSTRRGETGQHDDDDHDDAVPNDPV